MAETKKGQPKGWMVDIMKKRGIKKRKESKI